MRMMEKQLNFSNILQGDFGHAAHFTCGSDLIAHTALTLFLFDDDVFIVNRFALFLLSGGVGVSG